METPLTAFVDDYKKMSLSEIYVLSQNEHIRMSGMEEEKRYQTVVARRGTVFAKISVYEMVCFMPTKRDFKVTSDEQISEPQYRELIKGRSALPMK